jgi:hypothetical protein
LNTGPAALLDTSVKGWNSWVVARLENGDVWLKLITLLAGGGLIVSSQVMSLEPALSASYGCYLLAAVLDGSFSEARAGRTLDFMRPH